MMRIDFRTTEFRRYAAIPLVFLLLFTWQLALADGEKPQSWLSESGMYRISYTASLDPIEINQIHRWVLHVETVEGDLVTDADITIEGGMPMHNHGLPTSPQVTQTSNDGAYTIEGMRFHMMGEWEVRINITAANQSDSVIIPLKL